MEIDTNNVKKAPFPTWDPATRTSSLDTDKMVVLQNADQLHVAQRKEPISERPKIPATFFEKLSFYRAFTTSPSKTQIIGSHQVEFNRFFWFHVMNVFCKSLPNTYIYMFLSIYVPNQHLFLSKMIPIAYGSNWAFLVAGLINLITYTDVVVILLDYVICGILYKEPWNRCPKVMSKRRKCYNIQEFSTMLQNETVYFLDGQYKSYANYSIDFAPLAYYRSRWLAMINVYFYFALIWILAAIHYRQLFNKILWKALHVAQLILTVIYVVNFGHLFMSYYETELKNVRTPKSRIDDALWDADMDILSESMTAPPVIHIITSRSIEKVQPEYGSIAIVLSNSLYYIFRGILAYRLKKHCENLLKFPILLSEFRVRNVLFRTYLEKEREKKKARMAIWQLKMPCILYFILALGVGGTGARGIIITARAENPNSFFYLWPIYFSTFPLGHFYTVIYFLLSFIVEFLTITISLQCLIETIVCEWKCARREVVTIIIIIIGILHKIFTHFRARLLLYVYGVSMATMFEILILYCVYPLGRLIDDITFFYGVRPTTFRILNMQMVPIYYTLKMYGMYKGFFRIIDITRWAEKAPYYLIILYLMSVPFVLGTIYVVIKCLYVDKKSLKCLFKPIPQWGPKDRVLRQLRKKYDSRYYVDSQAPRKISRYMIQKSSLESYKLDVKYDNYLRRSSNIATEIHTEDEKKRK